MFWTILLGLLIGYEGEVARVRAVDGDAKVLPYGATEWEYLTINDVIGEGDIVKTLYDSRLVFVFGRGNVVSMGENTELEVNRLDDDFNFRLNEGKIRVMTRDGAGKIKILNNRIEVEDYTTVRVQKRGAIAKVSVIRGEAYVDNEVIRAGEMARLYPDGKIVIRREFHYDDFDEWASRFERRYVVGRRVYYVPECIYIGVWDLDEYGRWEYIPPFGWVWIPDVPPDWRPYYYGHWVFRVRIGWVWVSYEEWGWVPYHYGRWAWVSGIGWVWVPGRRWRGAWVVWYEGPTWIAWAPIDPYGEPILYVSSRGRRRWVAPVIDRHSFSKPVYRYKPPVNGRYSKPVYTTIKPVQIQVKDLKKYEKPVLTQLPGYIKPRYRQAWLKKAVEEARIVKKPIIIKKPVGSVKTDIAHKNEVKPSRGDVYRIKPDRSIRSSHLSQREQMDGEMKRESRRSVYSGRVKIYYTKPSSSDELREREGRKRVKIVPNRRPVRPHTQERIKIDSHKQKTQPYKRPMKKQKKGEKQTR